MDMKRSWPEEKGNGQCVTSASMTQSIMQSRFLNFIFNLFWTIFNCFQFTSCLKMFSLIFLFHDLFEFIVVKQIEDVQTLYVRKTKQFLNRCTKACSSLETTRTQTSNCCSTCTPCHVCWFNLFLKSSVCFTSFNQSQLASADPLRLKKLKPSFLCTCDVPELQSDFLFIRPVQQLNGEIHCRRKQSVLETQQERNETAWRHIYTGSSKCENKLKKSPIVSLWFFWSETSVKLFIKRKEVRAGFVQLNLHSFSAASIYV